MCEKEVIKSLWNTIAQMKWDSLRDYFHEDARIEWPCTNEIFDVSGFIVANAKYPSNWKETLKEVHKMDDEWISFTTVENEEMKFSAISIFTFKDQRISYLREYWCSHEAAPLWRQKLNLNHK